MKLTKKQERFNKEFVEFIRRPEIFTLQGCEGDWLCGGCWKLAHAILLWLGAQHVELWAVAEFDLQHHVVAKLGKYFLDGDGLADKKELINRTAREMLVHPEILDIVPFTPEYNCPIPAPDKKTKILAEELAKQFNHYFIEE